MKQLNVRMIARVFIILGVSSIVAAVFCAFYFSDATMSITYTIPSYRGRFPLEQYSPVFFGVGLVLFAIGWILRDYALRPAQ